MAHSAGSETNCDQNVAGESRCGGVTTRSVVIHDTHPEPLEGDHRAATAAGGTSTANSNTFSRSGFTSRTRPERSGRASFAGNAQ